MLNYVFFEIIKFLFEIFFCIVNDWTNIRKNQFN